MSLAILGRLWFLVSSFLLLPLVAGRAQEPQPDEILVGPIVLRDGDTLAHKRITGGETTPLGAAVLVKNGRAWITDCVIDSGPGAGILLLNADVSLDSCIIRGFRVGISARHSSLKIDRGRIEGNTERGLEAQEGSRAALRSTSVLRNKEDGLVAGALSQIVLLRTVFSGNGRDSRPIFSNSRIRQGTEEDFQTFEREGMTARGTSSSQSTEGERKEREKGFSIIERELAERGFSTADFALPRDTAFHWPSPMARVMDSPIEGAFEMTAEEEEFPSWFPFFLETLLSRGREENLRLFSKDRSVAGLCADWRFAMGFASSAVRNIPDLKDIVAALTEENAPGTLFEEHILGPKERAFTAGVEGRLAAIDTAAVSAAAAGLIENLLIEPMPREELFQNMGRTCGIPVSPKTLAFRQKSAVQIWWIPFSRSNFSETTIFENLSRDQRKRGFLLVIGDSGSNDYPALEGVDYVIFDPGGDDRYHDAAFAESSVAVVVDLSGDDEYDGKTAVAHSGIAILRDSGSGKDRYLGAKNSQAVAVGGIAVLYDEGGNDLYRSREVSQGFAVGGTAVLLESGGDDRYEAGAFSQGVGGPGGRGFLIDLKGEDHYEIASSIKDALRSGRRSLSFGQGFGIGLRPGSAGGFGVLWDANGDDHYEAGLFAQGSAYWRGVGVLYDGAGDDHYEAWQYVQGSGVHLSAGILIDAAGDDVYHSWSLSQGCGHDLATGILLDLSGDDVVTAYSRAQGMGLTNGNGLYFDGDGEDRYLLGLPSQGRGRGWFEPSVRKFGSLGIFLDLGGRQDIYDEPGKNGAEWGGGEVGIGVDR